MAGNFLPVSFTVTSNADVWGQPVGVKRTMGGFNPIDWQHVRASVAVATELNDFRLVKLSEAMPNTLLGMNKDLFFGNVDMFLRLTLAPGAKVCWCGTSANDPSVGAAATTAPANMGNGDPGVTGYYIRNLTLFLAVEQNEVISDSVRAKFNSPGGITLQMPYVVAQKYSSNALNVNFQYSFSASNGKKLRSILWSVWNNTATEYYNTAYDCANWSGARITSYNTFLDSNPLQQYPLSCSQSVVGAQRNDDWLWNKPFLEDSLIFNQGIYQLLWHHQDRFSEKPTGEQLELQDNINDGLSLGNMAHLWSVQATCNGIQNLVHYVFFTYLRDVSISATSIEIV